MAESRARIAFFSPFNPQRSGISDYSEELLPHLAPHADIDLIVPGYRISNDTIRERFRIRTPEEFTADSSSYAGILYQIGNNFHHHAYMVPFMRSHPGTCVLHDFCLQYLMLGLTVGQGNLAALEAALTAGGGTHARGDARRLWWNSTDADRFELAPPLLWMSRGAIVHSEYAARLVRRAVPQLPLRVVQMGVPDGLPSTAAPALRARYGLHEKDFVCASISTASKSKRLPLALRAVRLALDRVPNLKFVVAGGGNVGDDARRLVRELGLDNAVSFTGWLSAEDYRGIIDLAHVAMDIRYPSGAETSASLTRALASGRPLIVSDQGTFSELPGDCSIKIPVEQANEDRLIADALVLLAGDELRRKAMAAAARDFSVRHLRLEDTGRACVEFALSVGANKPPAWFRPWPPAATGSASAVRLIYRATRVLHLLRQYGPADTLRRVRAELAAQGKAGAAGL